VRIRTATDATGLQRTESSFRLLFDATGGRADPHALTEFTLADAQPALTGAARGPGGFAAALEPVRRPGLGLVDRVEELARWAPCRTKAAKLRPAQALLLRP
jgi:hypothetical protein